MSIPSVPDEETLSFLRRIYEYDFKTGHIFRIYNRTMYGPSVRLVTWPKHRYIAVRHSGLDYYAHHLAWFLHYGEWPLMEIDHIDGNGKNNKIDNLRCVTRAQQVQNADRRRGNGFHGVWYNSAHDRYSFGAKVKGRKYGRGRYMSEFEAVIAREQLLNEIDDTFSLRNNLFWIDGG